MSSCRSVTRRSRRRKTTARLRMSVFIWISIWKEDETAAVATAGTGASFECKWNSDLPSSTSDASSVKELLSLSLCFFPSLSLSMCIDDDKIASLFFSSLFVDVGMQQVHRGSMLEKRKPVGWSEEWELEFFWLDRMTFEREDRKEEKKIIGFLPLFSCLLPLRDWWS